MNSYEGMAQHEPAILTKMLDNHWDLTRLPGDSFLDVGCGQGYTYDYLKPKGYRGVDINPAEIAVAKERHPDVQFEVGDLYDLSGSYDLVYCSRVLVHLDRFEDAMERLLSVAKKHCVITVKIGPDKVDTYDDHIFRWYSEATLRAVGNCRIVPHEKYSTVIYDC